MKAPDTPHCSSISCSGQYLVFGPQQAEVLARDAVANEMHSVVLDAEIQISKPENHPERQEEHANNPANQKQRPEPSGPLQNTHL